MYFSPGWTLVVQFEGNTFVYYIYFRFANLLDVLSSLLDGGGPSQNKSMYGIVLSFSRSFNGRRGDDNHLILLRDDKDLEDSSTPFTSSSLLVVLSSFTSASSFTPMSFSCTSAPHLIFLRFVSASSTFSTSGLVWTAKMEWDRSHHNIVFQHVCYVPTMG